MNSSKVLPKLSCGVSDCRIEQQASQLSLNYLDRFKNIANDSKLFVHGTALLSSHPHKLAIGLLWSISKREGRTFAFT